MLIEGIEDDEKDETFSEKCRMRILSHVMYMQFCLVGYIVFFICSSIYLGIFVFGTLL